MSRVFGWASLRDTSYRGVVGKSGCVVGVGGAGRYGVGSFGGGWSGALSVAFRGDLYVLSSCGYCVIGRSCSLNGFLEARAYV